MNSAASGYDGVNAMPSLVDFIDPQRIVLDLDTTSRKRLFEHIATVSSSGLESVTEDCILKTITERERIGSTGLGHGIAVPHGRIENLGQPVISVIRLRQAIDYDAPDDEPVWLAVGLLVPADASETHLRLLSLLVARFQDREFVQSMKSCHSREQVKDLFNSEVSGTQDGG
jgi:PTS system nitrogen regulatory IIA component